MCLRKRRRLFESSTFGAGKKLENEIVLRERERDKNSKPRVSTTMLSTRTQLNGYKIIIEFRFVRYEDVNTPLDMMGKDFNL